MAEVVEVLLPERSCRLDDGRLARITNLFDRHGQETTSVFACVAGVAQARDPWGRLLADEWHAFRIYPHERAQ